MGLPWEAFFLNIGGHPTPDTPHPAPSTPHPAPRTQHPAPFTLYFVLFTFHPPYRKSVFQIIFKSPRKVRL